MSDKPFNPLTIVDDSQPTLIERIRYRLARRKILKSKKTKDVSFWYNAPKWLFTDKYYDKDET
jgi:hypothetical protein